MLRRRQALWRIAGGVLTSMWALVSCSPWRRRPGSEDSQIDDSASATDLRLGEAMRQDLARLEQRAYSEEGIPVLLIGVNLANDAPAGRRSTAERRARAPLAEAFDRHARVFQSINPKATGADVAKVIELLAEREFGPSRQTIRQRNR